MRRNVPLASGQFSTSVPNTKKRRTSRIKNTKQLSRSTSNPQIHDVMLSDSEIDKKRNKLGYQRISIACAHCRRRKIRCLVADDDPQQRCQNCIRLKKECVFYPVDQQSAMENKSEPSPQGPQPAPSVVSSSQAVGNSEQLFEHRQQLIPSSLPSNIGHPYQNLPVGPVSPYVSHGSYPPTDYSYTWSHDGRIHWNPSPPMNEMRQSPIVSNIADGAINSPWNYGRSAGDYAPFPVTDTMQIQSTLPQSFIPNDLPNGHTWQQHVTESVPSNNDPRAFQQSHSHQAAQLRYVHSALMPATGAPMISGSESNFYIPSHQNYRTDWYSDAGSFEIVEEEGNNYLSGGQQPD